MESSGCQDSEGDEEPLVIKMLQSMLATKKTVGYRQQQNEYIPSGEQIAVEIEKNAMNDKMEQQRKEIEQQDYERLLKCQKLFEPLYQRSTLTGGEIAKMSRISPNPIYQTLQAQKEEREYYLALVKQHGLQDSIQSYEIDVNETED